MKITCWRMSRETWDICKLHYWQLMGLLLQPVCSVRAVKHFERIMPAKPSQQNSFFKFGVILKIQTNDTTYNWAWLADLKLFLGFHCLYQFSNCKRCISFHLVFIVIPCIILIYIFIITYFNLLLVVITLFFFLCTIIILFFWTWRFKTKTSIILHHL